MKTYKVSETLKERILIILKRRMIKHEFFEEDGQTYVRLNMSGNKFHSIVTRAKCEKIAEEKNYPPGIICALHSEMMDENFCLEIEGKAISFLDEKI